MSPEVLELRGAEKGEEGNSPLALGCRRVIQVRLWDQSPGGEGTSSGGGDVTWQRAERGEGTGRNEGCLTQREGEDDPMGPWPHFTQLQ